MVAIRGEKLNEGKTKIIYAHAQNANLVVVESKDDITAGDGVKHDIVEGKAAWSNQTTCNVFNLLKQCGVHTAYDEKVGLRSFTALKCSMLPYEVVIRRVAKGSYLKRNPHITDGQLFPQLLCEFYLKTSGKNWKGKPLEADDPLLEYCRGGPIRLFNPAKPRHGAAPFLELDCQEVFSAPEDHVLFPAMEKVARKVFLILERAWQLEGRTLCDFKIEFGIDTFGRLTLADVIDADSWRVLYEGKHEDKQIYRDGGTLNEVEAKFAQTAELTDRFRIPSQEVIFWRGSEHDDMGPFIKALDGMASYHTVTCSAHKQPVQAFEQLCARTHFLPDSVIIAYIGMSNGAGPTLSAQTTLPVITVPANAKDFPEDVWSSLRGPSNVPVLTVLSPSNAVLAALNILSARNPMLYAHLRGKIEERMENVVRI